MNSSSIRSFLNILCSCPFQQSTFAPSCACLSTASHLPHAGLHSSLLPYLFHFTTLFPKNHTRSTLVHTRHTRSFLFCLFHFRLSINSSSFVHHPPFADFLRLPFAICLFAFTSILPSNWHSLSTFLLVLFNYRLVPCPFSDKLNSRADIIPCRSSSHLSLIFCLFFSSLTLTCFSTLSTFSSTLNSSTRPLLRQLVHPHHTRYSLCQLYTLYFFALQIYFTPAHDLYDLTRSPV